jgi:hypothetical protein
MKSVENTTEDHAIFLRRFDEDGAENSCKKIRQSRAGLLSVEMHAFAVALERKNS